MKLLKDWPRTEASTAKTLRAAGDKARDGKDWKAAATAYEKYLESSSDDAGIWVQYAHVLKEQDLLTEAEAAYRRAVEIVPADAESRLHLAHLLKRVDKPRQAAAMFREVMALAPTSEVITELQSFGQETEAKAIVANQPLQAAENGRYIELKDLFQYLSSHLTVTGITRVTLGLVNYVLEELDESDANLFHFVQQYGDGEGLLLIPKAKLRRVVRMAMGDKPDLEAMQLLIADIRATSPLIRLGNGHLYLIVGAFWEFVANPSWLGGMKQQGVAVGAYIYDLIPITHSHYCMAPLTDAFTAAFAETVRLLDFALTISVFVAKQVTDYVQQHHITPFPTIAVPLAHELRFKSERARRRLHASVISDELGDNPFVLCVCTIEARKNHIYLFYIWQRMIAAGIEVPDLVFVGRPGWRIQDLMDQIDSSRHLDGRLHIMFGLSDDDLAALYDGCLFTVFPSFVEGWGLPVGESLAHGKVCVASSTTSIPEVGGDLVVYVDPFNLESGYKIISGLINDPASLAKLEAKLKKSFTARTWEDVGRDFFSKLDHVLLDIRQQPNRHPVYAPMLEAGEILDVMTMHNVGARGAQYISNPERLAFSEGWRTVETTGTWMRESTAKLRVKTSCKPGQTLSVLLHVGTSPWVGEQNTLRVSASKAFLKRRENGNSTYTISMRKNANFWVKLKGEVDTLGYLTVHFRVEGIIEVAKSSDVPVALRLYAAGYAAYDDVFGRLSLLEHALISSN